MSRSQEKSTKQPLSTLFNGSNIRQLISERNKRLISANSSALLADNINKYATLPSSSKQGDNKENRLAYQDVSENALPRNRSQSLGYFSRSDSASTEISQTSHIPQIYADDMSMGERARANSSGRRTRTFYEEFKTSFPTLVRENEETMKRQSYSSTGSAGRHPLTGDPITVLSIEHDARTKELQECKTKKKNLEVQIDDLQANIERLMQQKYDLERELELVVEQEDDLKEIINDLLERISNEESSSSDSSGIVSPLHYLAMDNRNYYNTSAGCLKTLSGHKAPVMCLDFNRPHDVLASGSKDGVTRIWDLGTGRCLININAHSGSTKCLQYDGEIMISGGDDKKLKIWRIGSVALGTLSYKDEDYVPRILQGHYGPINCLQFNRSEGKLISGSEDGKVKIWDLNQSNCVNTLHINHSEHDLIIAESDLLNNRSVGLAPLASITETVKGVGALQFYSHALATGSQDGIIRLWDTRIKPTYAHSEFNFNTSEFLETRHEISSNINSACKRSFAGHSLPITSLCFDDTHLVSGSLDKTIKVWDLRTGQIVEGFVSPSVNGIQDFELRKDKLICAAGDRDITIFDRKSHSQTRLEGHMSMVNCLKYREGVLVSGAEDACIKVWTM